MKPPNSGHAWDPAFCPFERLSSLEGYFCIECILYGTFRMSFVERFVLFKTVGSKIKGGEALGVVRDVVKTFEQLRDYRG